MEGLAKVQAMRGKPSADVWFVAQGVAQRAATDPACSRQCQSPSSATGTT